MVRSFRIFSLLALSLQAGAVWADDAAVIKMIKEKGGEVTEANGRATSLTLSDGSKLTEAEFRQIGQLGNLKTLTLSNCLNDQTLGFLTTLTELESLQTNLMQVSDEGIKQLAQLKKLRQVKFFHPGKTFTGVGLAALADLPNLEALTVAGSFAFGDEGMAAVAKLTHLKSFRTWHAGQTIEGVKKLREMKNLKSLHLGQRLTYKAPSCPNDEVVAVLAEIKTLDTLILDEARLSLDALSKLKQLPELKTLTLGNIDMPEADMEKLQKEMPKVTIKWTKPTETAVKRIVALFGK